MDHETKVRISAICDACMVVLFSITFFMGFLMLIGDMSARFLGGIIIFLSFFQILVFWPSMFGLSTYVLDKKSVKLIREARKS